MLTVSKTKMRDSTWFVAFGLCLLSRERHIDRHIGSIGDFTKTVKTYIAKLFEQFRP